MGEKDEKMKRDEMRNGGSCECAQKMESELLCVKSGTWSIELKVAKSRLVAFKSGIYGGNLFICETVSVNL
jgi:hypothetical protein